MPDTVVFLEMTDGAYRKMLQPLRISLAAQYGPTHRLESVRRAPSHSPLSEEYLTHVAQQAANAVQCRNIERCGYIALKEIELEKGGRKMGSVSAVLIVGADRKGFASVRLFALGLDKVEVEAARAVTHWLIKLTDTLLQCSGKRSETEQKAAREFVETLMQLFPSTRPPEGSKLN
jgi:hypothetical protein